MIIKSYLTSLTPPPPFLTCTVGIEWFVRLTGDNSCKALRILASTGETPSEHGLLLLELAQVLSPETQ